MVEEQSIEKIITTTITYKYSTETGKSMVSQRRIKDTVKMARLHGTHGDCRGQHKQ